MNRRRFLKLMGLAAAGAALPWKFNLRQGFTSGRAFAFSQTPILAKFVDTLPGLGPSGANGTGQYLTVMTPNDPGNLFPGSDYYHLVASQFQQKVHPSLPTTTFWGYAQDGGPGDTSQKYLGGIIVAQADRPVRLTMRNALPSPHILPVDRTLSMWNGYTDMNGNAIPGMAYGVNRMSVHLHGGFPPWISDGTPFQEFDPNGGYGASAGQPPDMPAPTITPPGSYSYYWTNQQVAKFMWYHDHAMDITRLNAYAGLATGYVLTDSNEQNLIATGILPAPAQTVYLVLQDKTFNANGSLWYPYEYEENPGELGATPPWGTPSGRWDWSGPAATEPSGNLNSLANPSLIPEYFADTTIINGCCYPYMTVQRRHYRFRILNGAPARFYNLQLYYAPHNAPTEVKMVPATGGIYTGPYGLVTVPNDGRPGGVPDPTMAGPMITQIGTEGGFLPAPVGLNNPPQPIAYDTTPGSLTLGNATAYTLVLAPAERCDFIIDFTDVPAGANLILYSDAPGPFPMGDDRNDYFTGNPDHSGTGDNTGGAPSTLAGYGPNSRTLMQFRVVDLPVLAASKSLNTLANLALAKTKSAILTDIVPLPQKGVRVRRLTLNETFETAATSGTPYYGRLIQMLGTTVTQGNDQWGVPMFYRGFQEGRGEVVKSGATEIWELYNLTGDTHPIHFHLVNVQVLNRQVFDDETYSTDALSAPPGTDFNPNPYLKGLPIAPDANELGWKETVRMNPHTVTRVIMRFDLPKLPWPVPISTRLASPMKPAGPNNPRINGYEYMWHCHILEHEEHDMMHSLVVDTKTNIVPSLYEILLNDKEE